MSVIVSSTRELLPFLILAAVALLLLLHWSRRNVHRHVTIEEFSLAQEAVDSLTGEFSLVRRLFEPDDMRFISRQPSPEARHVFLRERKTLAISWLRHLRRQLGHLKDLHLTLASYTNHPSPRVDLGFLTDYLIFAVVCNVLLVLVWIRGPFQLATIVGYNLNAVSQFCGVFSRRLEDVNAGLLSPADRTHVA